MFSKLLLLLGVSFGSLLLLPIILAVVAMVIVFKVMLPKAKKANRDRAEMYASYINDNTQMSNDNFFKDN